MDTALSPWLRASIVGTPLTRGLSLHKYIHFLVLTSGIYFDNAQCCPPFAAKRKKYSPQLSPMNDSHAATRASKSVEVILHYSLNMQELVI